MELPDFYLKRYITGAELHVHLTGSLKDFAKNLRVIADNLQQALDKHTVEELLNPKTTPLKFSRPTEFDNNGEGRIRLIETWKTGHDAAITKLYDELSEIEDDKLFKKKNDQLLRLQQLEADIFSRNAARQDTFSKENWEKLHAETQAILEKYGLKEATSPFSRLDRVVCKEYQSVTLFMGDRGVVLGNTSPEDLMEHEDPNEPKVHVVWDGKKMQEKDGKEYLDCIGSTHTSPKDLELADPMPGDPIFLLQAMLYDKYYPEVDTEMDGTADQEKGIWFLDITSHSTEKDCGFPVGFHPGQGFSFCTCGDPGYGQHSDEIIESVEDAFKRTVELIETGHKLLKT